MIDVLLVERICKDNNGDWQAIRLVLIALYPETPEEKLLELCKQAYRKRLTT